MTACARFIEQKVSALCDRNIEASGGRRRRWQTELISPQRRELRGHQVRRVHDVDPESWIGEVALPAHLGYSDIGIPIGNRSLRRVGFVLDVG